ncbi:MAG: hypothetical protein RL757_2309 [Bacteroidota bacterium]
MAAAVATALLTTSCGGSDPVEPTPVKTYGKVLFSHSAYNAPRVQVLVDGVAIGTDSIGYTQNSQYKDVQTGARRIVHVHVGANAVLTDTLPLLNKDVNYSYFVYRDSANRLRRLFTSDDLAAPASGKAKIRLFHAGYDAGAVNVEAVAPNGVATSNNTFSIVAFENLTSATELTAGTYDLKIKIPGTLSILKSINGISLEAGKVYTLVLSGNITMANALTVTKIQQN